MSATTNRRYKVVRPSEMHGRNYVRNARASGDYLWTFAETCIPDSTRLVVARVRRLKNLPGKGRVECCDFHNDLNCRDCTSIPWRRRYSRFGLARTPL